MDLVAVHDGLSLFVRRHEGGEAADGEGRGVADEDVPELRGLHFFELLGGVPLCGGVFVVGATGFFQEGEAGLEIGGCEVGGTGKGEVVKVVGLRMDPFCGPR